MKIVQNSLIPPFPYKAITLLNCIFIKKGTVLSDKNINHEEVHWKQQIEMFFIFFYLWYIIEFLVKLIITKNWQRAYHSISLEQEAYERENNNSWIEFRPHYYWKQFITKII